jgi:protein-disulfide isomerase
MAPAAHKAMMAAGKQNKFWEFHDALFDRSGALEEGALREVAQKLGLDLARWDRDRQDPALAARIDADLRSGQSAGVDGTPSMFLNGRRIVGAVPLQELVDVAEQELKRARAAGWKGHAGYLKAIAGGQVRPAAAEQARPQPAAIPAK